MSTASRTGQCCADPRLKRILGAGIRRVLHENATGRSVRPAGAVKPCDSLDSRGERIDRLYYPQRGLEASSGATCNASGFTKN